MRALLLAAALALSACAGALDPLDRAADVVIGPADGIEARAYRACGVAGIVQAATLDYRALSEARPSALVALGAIEAGLYGACQRGAALALAGDPQAQLHAAIGGALDAAIAAGAALAGGVPALEPRGTPGQRLSRAWLLLGIGEGARARMAAVRQDLAALAAAGAPPGAAQWKAMIEAVDRGHAKVQGGPS